MAGDKDGDSASEWTSTTGSPILTPTTTVYGGDMPSGRTSTTSSTSRPTNDLPPFERLLQSHGDVPWPSNTYIIIEKGTNKAITSLGDTPVLMTLDDSSTRNPRTLWHCVEKQGFFAFQNPASGRFLGHDGKSGMRASASELNRWEMWTPREHPEGGYQLLSPYYSATLMVLCAGEDGKELARRTHGTTLWQFVRV